MVYPRVTKALNPQKRKLTLKQIKAGFGGKRRRTALKSKRRASGHKHRAASVSNPKRAPKKKRRVARKAKNATKTKVVYRTRTRKVYVEKPRRRAKAKANPKRRRKTNPYLMTLSPVMGNPHKKRRRKTAMAKTKRKASAKRSGKRRNPTRRRSVKRSSHRLRRSSNPFGQSGSKILKVGVGVFLGASTAKKLPQFYPPNMTASPMMAVFSTGLTAAALAYLAQRFAATRGDIADGILWGGMAQTINVAWNAFAPPSLAQFATLGDFVNGGFPLPQGPVRMPIAAAPFETPTGSQVNIGAAYGRAW